MSRPTGEDENVDPDAVARRLRERAASTKRRQVALATAKLDDDDQRDELAELGERLVDRVLAGPLGTLALAAERNDPELAQTVATLFDVESRLETSDDANNDTRETPLLEQ